MAMTVLVTLEEGGNWHVCDDLTTAVHGTKTGRFSAFMIHDETRRDSAIFDSVLANRGCWPWRRGPMLLQNPPEYPFAPKIEVPC